eukprot:Nitzschia sp. Nitz4//scaffold181_size46380//35649//37583//NITZ4_007184-RA/size46380-processed-gene-0.29-mRNA-1//1//CDS//3329539531//8853//frame0
MAEPLDAFALSASGSFPSERYEEFPTQKDYDDNKSILDYESIATGLKSLQRSMGWYDGRDDDNEKEDTRYLQRASSTLSDMESEHDSDDDEDEESVWSEDSFPSTIASEELNEETRSTSRVEKKKPKGKSSLMSLKSWGRGNKKSNLVTQPTRTNKSAPRTSAPALDGISRGQVGSVASSRRSRRSQQRESNLECRDSPPTIASGRRNEASKSTTRTSSTPKHPVAKNSLTRQPKHTETESVYSSASTAKDSRVKDRKSSKGLWSMSFGGRSKQSYKKRMSKAHEKESKKLPEASNEENSARPPVPVKSKDVSNKSNKPRQSSKPNEQKTVASKRSKASSKSEAPFNLQILDTQDSASWLGALADKFETWSKGEHRPSMADFEDNRLGDLRVAPKRTGTTRRLEIAEENATLDSLDRILSNDSDSLTNSMPFQLSESELDSIASDSWDNGTRGTRGTRETRGTKVTWATKDSKGTRGTRETRGTMGTMDTKGTLRTLRSTNAQAWKEIVECAEVIAYHGQCDRLNIRLSTREKQKFRRALEVFRDHAERLKMSDRELFTAIRDDPTVLNENSTFDDDETLDYLWEGLGFDDGMDRYVDAFEGMLQCGAGADREAPKAKKQPLISDEMSALGQQAYQRASKPKRK